MMTYQEILSVVQTLPATEKARLLEEISASLHRDLEGEAYKQLDWHEFIERTAGSLRDTPIQRWEQGEYEKREPLE